MDAALAAAGGRDEEGDELKLGLDKARGRLYTIGVRTRTRMRAAREIAGLTISRQ